MKEMAQYIEELARYFAPEGVVLVGHSMMGKVNMVVASQRPTNLLGLVLVDPPSRTRSWLIQGRWNFCDSDFTSALGNARRRCMSWKRVLSWINARSFSPLSHRKEEMPRTSATRRVSRVPPAYRWSIKLRRNQKDSWIAVTTRTVAHMRTLGTRDERIGLNVLIN